MFINAPSNAKIKMDIFSGLNAAKIALEEIHHLKYRVMQVIIT
jgi:hypothetical protein